VKSAYYGASHYATFSILQLLPLSFSHKLWYGLRSNIHRTRRRRPTLCLASHKPVKLSRVPAVSSISRQSPFLLRIRDQHRILEGKDPIKHSFFNTAIFSASYERRVSGCVWIPALSFLSINLIYFIRHCSHMAGRCI